jgi:uncharacterized protein YndB with AHSA1/START domain
MQEIALEATSAAPRERVWALLADTASWADWAPFETAAVATPGPEQPEGVGMVRHLGRGRGRVTVERISVFEPPERFGYELVSGVPVRDYNALVTLAEEPGGGTVISWRSTFHGKFPVPAALVRWALARFIRDTVEGLARAAER